MEKEKKRNELAAQKKAEREFKRAQLDLQILVNSINKHLSGSLWKSCIYNWFLR